MQKTWQYVLLTKNGCCKKDIWICMKNTITQTHAHMHTHMAYKWECLEEKQNHEIIGIEVVSCGKCVVSFIFCLLFPAFLIFPVFWSTWCNEHSKLMMVAQIKHWNTFFRVNNHQNSYRSTSLILKDKNVEE